MLRTRERPWLTVGLLATLTASLSACGAGQVETVAHEDALDLLNEHLTEAVACLRSTAPQLDAADTSEDLANTLAECGNTTALNKDDEQIVEEGLGGRASVIFSGAVVGDPIVLRVMTTGTGYAQAGVASARAYLVTCWQATIDVTAHVDTEFAASPCNDALLLLYDPSAEQVPLSDLHVPGA